MRWEVASIAWAKTLTDPDGEFLDFVLKIKKGRGTVCNHKPVSASNGKIVVPSKVTPKPMVARFSFEVLKSYAPVELSGQVE